MRKEQPYHDGLLRPAGKSHPLTSHQTTDFSEANQGPKSAALRASVTSTEAWEWGQTPPQVLSEDSEETDLSSVPSSAWARTSSKLRFVPATQSAASIANSDETDLGRTPFFWLNFTMRRSHYASRFMHATHQPEA
jgi:hypothetical protein